jgi:hypothetical protein
MFTDQEANLKVRSHSGISFMHSRLSVDFLQIKFLGFKKSLFWGGILMIMSEVLSWHFHQRTYSF